MTAEVLRLVPPSVGDAYEIAPDQVLDAAKGKYETVIVVGETADGEIEIAGSAGAGDALALLLWATNFLVQNRTARAP